MREGKKTVYLDIFHDFSENTMRSNNFFWFKICNQVNKYYMVWSGSVVPFLSQVSISGLHSLYECCWVSIFWASVIFLNNIKPFYCYSYLLKISIMVLTRSQYKNISKEELNQELTEINSSFVNDINRKLTNCLISLTNLHQNMINWYLHRKSILSCSKRETIELKPVPAEIHEDVLKESIYKAL